MTTDSDRDSAFEAIRTAGARFEAARYANTIGLEFAQNEEWVNARLWFKRAIKALTEGSPAADFPVPKPQQFGPEWAAVYASLYYNLAHTFMGSGDMAVAEKTYEEAATYAKLKSLPEIAAQCYSDMAFCLVPMEDLPRALRLFDEAGSIYLSLGYRLDEANVALREGDLVLKAGKLDLAQKYLTFSAQVYQELRDVEGGVQSARLLVVLSDRLAEAGRMSLSLETLEIARTTFQHLEATEDLIKVAQRTAGRLDSLGKFAEAESWYSSVAVSLGELGDEKGKIDALYALAWSQVRHRRSNESLETLRLLETDESNGYQTSNPIDTLVHAEIALAEYRDVDAERLITHSRVALSEKHLDSYLPICDELDGHLNYRKKKFELAAESYLRAAEAYEARGAQSSLAGALHDLGNSQLALYIQGNHFASTPLQVHDGAIHRGPDLLSQGVDNLRRARDIYIQLGLIHAAAGCDAVFGEFQCVRPAELVLTRPEDLHNFGRLASSQAEQGLDILLPAVLYMDQVRFQFRDSETRHKWMSQTLYFIRAAAQAAARFGNHKLVASLIEIVINDGLYGAQTVSYLSTDTKKVSDDLDSNPVKGTESESAASLVLASGASRLIAGAALPCSPSPMLQMPWHDVALADAYDAAIERYGDWQRPREVVPVW